LKPELELEVYEPSALTLLVSLAVRDLTTLLSRLSDLLLEAKWDGSLELMSYSRKNLEIVIYPQTKAVNGRAVGELCRAFWSERGIAELRPSIGVVGPLYGGTLPVARYTASALESLGQRVQLFDLAGFNDAYKLFDEMLGTAPRQGTLKGHYVELLSQLVLEAVAEKPVDILICLAQAPMSPRALTELRNRGITTVLWFVEDGNRFSTWQQVAPFYDYIFVIQKGDFPQKVEAAGAGRALYLPCACHSESHKPLILDDEERSKWGSDVSFVGAGYNNRQHIFATLTEADFKIWGTEWPISPPFDRLVQEYGRRIDPEEYVKIFNATKVNLNLHSSTERDGVEPNGDFVNPRTFELAACGAFQLVDNRALLPELFDIGEELITFSDRAEMHEKIDYYLAHPDERRYHAERSRDRVLRDHTYEKRMRSMLGAIYADRYQEIRSRIESSPWEVMLREAQGLDELQNRMHRAYEAGDEPTLDTLVSEITTGKGALSDVEQKLLFLYHIGKQVSHVLTKRSRK
jgi:spore maturation protein CgeB